MIPRPDIFACLLIPDLLRNIYFVTGHLFPVFFTLFSSHIPLSDWADDPHDQSGLCCRSSPFDSHLHFSPSPAVVFHSPAPYRLYFPWFHPHFRRHGCENDFFPYRGPPKGLFAIFREPGNCNIIAGNHWAFCIGWLLRTFATFSYLILSSGQALVIFVSSVFFFGPSIDRDGMLDLWADRRNDKYPLCAVE